MIGRDVASRRPELAKKLARSLRRLRQEADLTQEAAASGAGMNIRHYQKLESASVNVTLRTIENLCVAFDVDVAELFE